MTKPTGDEQALVPAKRDELEQLQERRGQRPKRVRVLVEDDDGVRSIAFGNPDEEGSDMLHGMRLYEALGSGSQEFVSHCLERLHGGAIRQTGDAAKDGDALSAAIALIAAVGPTDEFEATMAIQMAAANDLALYALGQARLAQYVDQAKAFGNIGTKAMRAFALHAEAISKLRRGGKQVVEHVHVNAGGQAVIAGTVNTGGGGE